METGDFFIFSKKILYITMAGKILDITIGRLHAPFQGAVISGFLQKDGALGNVEADNLCPLTSFLYQVKL